MGCPSKTEMLIDVAIDELLGNIANYAYFPETGKATILFEAEEPSTVALTFIDEGKHFNLLEHTDPDLDPSSAQSRVGGLGIFIVKKMMDAVDYEYKDGKNVVRIKKRLA